MEIVKNIRNPFTPATGLIFYYDETNNIRKLVLREDATLNNELRDFILGGVAFKKGYCPNPEELLKECELSDACDVKSSSFFKHSDFLKCLGSKRLTLFLKWLAESELFVHFYYQDNLYFTFNDLVDSLLEFQEEDIDALYLGDVIKNDFYQFATKNLHPILKIFNRYSYPEISRKDVNAFCQDLLKLIEEHCSEKESFSLGVLKKSLVEIIDNDLDLSSVRKGESGIILDNFASTRIWCMHKAPDCKHIFDWERDAVNLVDKSDLPFDYEFVNSEDDRMIQISDIAVKLVYKYTEYVKSVDYKIPYDKLNVTMIDNFRRIQAIIERSYMVSLNMIEYSSPLYSAKNNRLAVDHLLLLEEVLKYKSGTKTIFDFVAMKEQKCIPFDNKQNWYISYLEDVYISKSDGKERLFGALGEWNKDAQIYIMNMVIDRMLE